MKAFTSIPLIADAPPELLSGSHLWIQEKIDGAVFRFEGRESGLLVFGGRDRVFDEGQVLGPYRHAARHVRERFDVDALRRAVERSDGIENVDEITFFGEATHRHTIDYDFDRLPSFLGCDVWSAGKERFLPPDVVERVFETLGLDPVNAFAKEVRATDFDPSSYEIPDSAWYDGPAAGVVLRNKTGVRAKLLHPQYRGGDGTVSTDETAPIDGRVPVDTTPDELARQHVTPRHVARVVASLEGQGRSSGFDAVYDRVLEDVVREEHGRLARGDASIGKRAFRSAVAARVREHLDDLDGQ